MLKTRRWTFVFLAFGLAVGSAVTGAGTAAGIPTGDCKPAVPFRADAFPEHPKIDNKFLPLVPGTQLTLQGQADVGGGLVDHTVVFTVTDVTKVINGVRSVVVLDEDISQGTLAEREIAFFAQDDSGNVWNTGEYPEEFEDGQFVGAPSTWLTGQQGAQAGIHMLAQPTAFDGFYLQGFSPKIAFLDCAQVVGIDDTQDTCVPAGCFNPVLITDETSPLERTDAHQLKYHAPGIGIIKIEPVNDPEGETLVLTKLTRLSKKALANASATALTLDQRAYEFAAQVYGGSSPATRGDAVA
ncbi:MAG TPA: hypothetical protein VGJ95_16450 [Pseudonocardiaceae bacterium]|jgi:hypothetical protein